MAGLPDWMLQWALFIVGIPFVAVLSAVLYVSAKALKGAWGWIFHR